MKVVIDWKDGDYFLRCFDRGNVDPLSRYLAPAKWMDRASEMDEYLVRWYARHVEESTAIRFILRTLDEKAEAEREKAEQAEEGTSHA